MSSYVNWILYFKVIYVFYMCEGKCTQYYVILKGNNIRNYKPVFINDINWSPYNTSKEYKFYKENRDCFINLQCSNTDSFQCSKRGGKFGKYKYENVTKLIEATPHSTYKEIEAITHHIFEEKGTTKRSNFKDNQITVEPTFKENISTSTPTYKENVSTSEPTIKENTTTLAPNFKENESTPAPTSDGQGGIIDFTAANWKTVGIGVASVAVTSLVLLIVVKQIIHCLQQRHYYLDNPHAAESGPGYNIPEAYQ